MANSGTLSDNISQPPQHKSRWRVTAIIAAVVVGLIVISLAIIGQRAGTPGYATLTLNSGTKAAKTYHLEVVTTQAAQEKGLSGRSGLAKDGGMLFSFKGTSRRCIWMKDMKFNIDILWLNSDKRVVSAVANMSPKSYPQNYCAAASSVIELPAGTMRSQGIRPGQVVQF
jgi:uncharacterized membrane protein (UPF0127 family)